MIHITRNKKERNLISAEAGLVKLNLSQNFPSGATEGFVSLVEEILQDHNSFEGTFSFKDNTVIVSLKSDIGIKTWERAVL